MVNLGNKWDEMLKDEFNKDYYLELRQFLKQEYNTKTIYPDKYKIFQALKMTGFDDVKVVILGQDPYHGFGQAHGLAFSVQPGTPPPPSLMNIFKELRDDMGCEMPDNGCLNSWAAQGALLLNTSLTVREAQPNSHRGKGWEIFTDRVIELLNAKTSPVVFMLWGANAKDKSRLITNESHLILTAPHPSPLSASKGFFGCRHFSKANAFLRRAGLNPIDWQIPSISNTAAAGAR